jgi:two-component system cell cycle response regulator
MKDHIIHVVEGIIDITQHRDRDLIGNSLVKTLSELIESDQVTLFDLHKKTDPVILTRECSVNPNWPQIISDGNGACLSKELSEGITQCLKTGELVEMGNSHQRRCQVIYPVLRHPGDIVGFLLVTHDDANANKHRLVHGLLKVYQNYLSLLVESQSDKLTGLLNRNTFDDNIMKIIGNPISRSSYVHLYDGTTRRIPDETFTYWLALIDIDGFKKINDTFGHIYGDEVLILLARLIKSSFRIDDLIFRFGGEEFIVVMKSPSQQDAEIALERFRLAVQNYSFPQIGRITVSTGYIQISSSDVPVVVLWQADQALYYAKKQGRNRACSYEQLIAEGKIKENAINISTLELFKNTFLKKPQKNLRN